jgi:hypothetical protein
MDEAVLVVCVAALFAAAFFAKKPRAGLDDPNQCCVVKHSPGITWDGVCVLCDPYLLIMGYEPMNPPKILVATALEMERRAKQ